MSALSLVITVAGLQRFTAAQLDDDIDLSISHVGLTDQAFVAAPTLTALPGQSRLLDTVSGQAVGDNIVHMIVRDEAALTYGVRGFALYLADGTLFAAYSQADRIVQKAVASTVLLAIDIAFPTADINALTFGATNFLDPPATTSTAGVARLATQAEVDAGVAANRIVTPATLAARLTGIANAILATVAAMIASALTGFVPVARQIATSGAILKGGGTLAADRTLHVDAATLPETIAAAADDKVVTPAVLTPWLVSVIAQATIVEGVLAPTGYRIHADGYIEQWGIESAAIAAEGQRAVVFPHAFPHECFGISGTVRNSAGTGTGDTQVQEVSVSTTGAAVYVQGDSGIADAAGGFRWRAWGY